MDAMNRYFVVGIEVLTAVVMKSTIFWNITKEVQLDWTHIAQELPYKTHY
jgi:hypothetical protein